ncbi:MAG: hypothetical protein ABSE93_25965 [Terriglobia bacterium]
MIDPRFVKYRRSVCFYEPSRKFRPMIDLTFVKYRRSLPKRQRDLLDALTRKLLAAGPAAPLSSARETWWRWIQRALPRATPAECKAMATYALAAVATGIINLQSPGQPVSASATATAGSGTVNWQSVGLPVAGATGASATVTSLQSPGQPPGTMSQLSAIQNELQNSLDSDNEISEMGSMQLQMLMDVRSKLLQTVSNIEKSTFDALQAIVGNIKW